MMQMQNEFDHYFEKRGNKKYLISPLADFLFLGGLSMIFFTFAIIFHDAKDKTYTLGWAMFYLGFIINYPHFLISYQLFYKNHKNEIKKNFKFLFVAIIFPIALIIIFILTVTLKQIALSSSLVTFMFMIVGWHYVKQIYGCIMMTSYLKGYEWSQQDKILLRVNMYSLWLISFVYANSYSSNVYYHGVSYPRFNLNSAFLKIGYFVLVFSLLAIIYKVYLKYIKTGETPAIGGVAAFFSIYFWYLPMLYNTAFFLMIPFFHSLQYLTFVYVLLKNKAISEVQNLQVEVARKLFLKKLCIPFFVAIILGGLSFRFIPLQLDRWFSYDEIIVGPTYFLFCADIILNLHHYFIDNLIWRSKQSNIKKYLLFKA